MIFLPVAEWMVTSSQTTRKARDEDVISSLESGANIHAANRIDKLIFT